MSPTRPLLVRDRPWSFGLAVVAAPLGAALFVMSLVLEGGGPRQDEVHEIVRMLGLVFMLLGGWAAWRARRCRFDPGRRGFVRGDRVCIDLREAELVVLWFDADDPRFNAAYAVRAHEPDARELLVGLNARDPEAGRRLAHAVHGPDPALVRVCWGLPAGVIRHVAEQLAEGLAVPLVRLRGHAFEGD